MLYEIRIYISMKQAPITIAHLESSSFYVANAALDKLIRDGLFPRTAHLAESSVSIPRLTIPEEDALPFELRTVRKPLSKESVDFIVGKLAKDNPVYTPSKNLPYPTSSRYQVIDRRKGVQSKSKYAR